ncbi:hypothetical protein SDRG_16705 [Saprolegnia diclina VS20]|uniref:Enoyl-CoA hydratase n=1 Tax=Saprolegnia diclina (strain VS20) TaxID=1156394 RepID=T0PJ89_SAPDV|nr:hypothetical protein SDRG_16705 [Saprolegnia diclina VS20]EQC25439.1 hypothetical protein SDRG_16705 [Saprolegnia diclina VS20]|eukprot:XP_008621145.1 hypothetical protein SDRG_16705 [Saprolegnia diclina VS20]
MAPTTKFTATWFARPSDESIAVIELRRPKVKNAINEAVYAELDALIGYYEAHPHVLAIVLTGAGDYFTSGMDLTSMPTEVPSRSATRRFMNRLIECPKILVAAVNGHAVGIGVTLLTHCDVVFAVETATFWTPFMRVGIVPEFGSSYLFPKILGPMLANDMLLRSKRVEAARAHAGGLVTELFPVTGFLDKVVDEVAAMVDQPCADESLLVFKRLVKEGKGIEKAKVLAAIEREYVDIDARFESGYLVEAAVKQFMAGKAGTSKL